MRGSTLSQRPWRERSVVSWRRTEHWCLRLSQHPQKLLPKPYRTAGGLNGRARYRSGTVTARGVAKFKIVASSFFTLGAMGGRRGGCGWIFFGFCKVENLFSRIRPLPPLWRPWPLTSPHLRKSERNFRDQKRVLAVTSVRVAPLGSGGNWSLFCEVQLFPQ